MYKRQVVRKEFLEEHEDAVKSFMEEHKASAEAINADPTTGAAPVSYTHLDVYKRQESIWYG